MGMDIQDLREVAVCDLCSRPRVIGNHERCSKIRQQMYAASNKRKRRPRSKSGGVR